MSNSERSGRNRSNFENRFVRTDFCGQRSYGSTGCIDEWTLGKLIAPLSVAI